VLVNGAWAPRWYWRNELEAMQDASRRMGYPDAHPSAVLRSDQPTDEFRPHPTEPGTSGRVWRYRTPAAAPVDPRTLTMPKQIRYRTPAAAPVDPRTLTMPKQMRCEAIRRLAEPARPGD
jgi:hypothetical protein